MVAQRQPGKINPNTALIDIGMGNVYGVTAVYLIQGDKSCLIDAGTRHEAPRLVQQLRELNAFPPDKIIVTHPHWDHTQGIPHLRSEAAKVGRTIDVLASSGAIPLLADATFNDDFGGGPYQAIRDVTVVNDGDTIDLGGVRLRTIDVPGHCRGHIAILDETNRNVFVGDAIGDKLADDIFLPPFMPSTWDAEAFHKSINTLKNLPYETLCLTHFGCISGREAKDILNEAVETYQTWWRWFESHADRLHHTRYLLHAMRREINPGIPDIRPMTTGLKFGLRILTTIATLIGRRTRVLDKLYYGHAIEWLAKGYEQSTNLLLKANDPEYDPIKMVLK